MERQSKYAYDNTETLVNIFGEKNESELNRIEAKFTYLRMVELEMDPSCVQGLHKQLFPGRRFIKFTKEHFVSVHAYIFQDVYPMSQDSISALGLGNKKHWVGAFREENIAKGNFRFADARFLEQSLDDVFHELHRERLEQVTEKKALAERIAYYVAELNVIHPMREGNGRATREIARQIALESNWDIDWSTIKDRIVDATIIASISNPAPLADLIAEAMVDNREMSKTP